MNSVREWLGYAVLPGSVSSEGKSRVVTPYTYSTPATSHRPTVYITSASTDNWIKHFVLGFEIGEGKLITVARYIYRPLIKREDR